MRPKPFERICSVCKSKSNKLNLVRFCKKDGEIKIDRNCLLGGKGAYICKECISNLEKNRGLNKAFKTNISQSVYEKVINDLKEF